MTIPVKCVCGQLLAAPDQYAGKRGECRACGRILMIPDFAAPVPPPIPAAGTPAPKESPLDVTEFFDPPTAAPTPVEKKPFSLRPMFEALLDPRSIQWMLMIGGALLVLGIIVWLVSEGIFKDPHVLAASLIGGTVVLMSAGWLVALRTRYKVAGHSLTFLSCVVAPLNLWFLHVHKLVTLDHKLWVGGLVCSLLYIVTVFALADPLFMYAVEVGITLTVGLFLAEANLASNATVVCIGALSLGLISIHAERAFSPDQGKFTRSRFGLPVFWCGQLQIAAGLLLLLTTQIAGWLERPVPFFQAGEGLVENYLLAGALWLVGTYAYLYSDLVVRRVGIYCYVAAVCLMMSEVTVVRGWLHTDGLLAVLALTALAGTVLQSLASDPQGKLHRAVPPLAMVLSAIPVLMGMVLHLRATSALYQPYLGGEYAAGPTFVGAMLVVALCNRASAFVYRRQAPNWSAAHYFLSGAAAIVAAAGLLRIVGVVNWTEQAQWLMLMPIGYLIAGRLWRGHSPERPLGWVAQAAAAVILVPVLLSALRMIESVLTVAQGDVENLRLGLIFTEATLFYTLAAIFRRRSANVYFATISACTALWQFLGFWSIPGGYHALLYATLGLALLIVGRGLGLEQVPVYGPTGEKGVATRGRGLPAFQMGNGILCIAILAALLQGSMWLAGGKWDAPDKDWTPVVAPFLTMLASLVGALLSQPGAWRRTYVTGAVALAAVTFLTLNVLSTLTGWQKLEIFCVIMGCVLVAVSYVGRFREVLGAEKHNEAITLGLWLGSLLATVPLLISVIYHRLPSGGHVPSWPDELALIIVTLMMLVTGCGWQVKSTTFFGGSTLVLYLAVVIVFLGVQTEVPTGVYLSVAGGVVFALGIALSVYRDKLLALPDKIAKREGLFRILTWR